MIEGWGALLYAVAGAAVGRLLGVCIERLPDEPPASPVPHRALVVSLLTAALFGLLWLQFGPGVRLLVVTLYVSTLIVITFIDLEHRLILNNVIYPAILLGLPAALLYGNSVVSTLLGGGVGFLILFGFFLLAERLYPGRNAMGAGDVKLATFIGVFVGFQQIFPALFLGSMFGGVGSLAVLVLRAKGMRDVIPYGPFICAGGIAVLFLYAGRS